MDGLSIKMKEQLEAKLAHINNMEKILRRQNELIDADDFTEFDKLCDQADRVVAEMKNIDYEIAILESSSDSGSKSIDPLKDAQISGLFSEMLGKAENNRELLSTLAEKLIESKNRIRKELDNTVALRQISGYMPYNQNTPVYFDKRN